MPACLLQWTLSLLRRNDGATTKLVILDSISGVLKPGRITLLLGPPSSGKSTLLKALSGRLEHSGLKVRLHTVPAASGAVLMVACGATLTQPILGSPPSSGKSTLLKALLGRLEHPGLKVRGLYFLCQ